MGEVVRTQHVWAGKISFFDLTYQEAEEMG